MSPSPFDTSSAIQALRQSHELSQIYADEILKFIQQPDLNRLSKVPPFPCSAPEQLLRALSAPGSWSEAERTAVLFFAHLAKINAKGAKAELYSNQLREIVSRIGQFDLEGEADHGDEVIGIMLDAGISAPEIAGCFNTCYWVYPKFVPLAHSNRDDQPEITIRWKRATAMLRHDPEGEQSNTRVLPVLTPLNFPTTAIERYILGLEDQELSLVLEALDGHRHILESLARKRLPAAQEWLAGKVAAKGLASLDAEQINALIRGSAEFDRQAVDYVRGAKSPVTTAFVVRQLYSLRPETHQALRDEYYARPEVAMDPEVMRDLALSDLRQAVSLLQAGVEQRLYDRHPDVHPGLYTEVYAGAARLWNKEAKEMFDVVARDGCGAEFVLEEVLNHAPVDAAEDLDHLLSLLCFQDSAPLLNEDMLRSVAKKRPGRMISGWWRIIDGNLKDYIGIASSALAAGLGTNAVSDGEKRLSHPKPVPRMGAAAMLAALGSRESVPQLTEQLDKEEHIKVRDAIHDALKLLGAAPKPVPVDPADVSDVLAKLEPDFTKKLAKAKMPPGDWWKIDDLAGLKSLDGAALSAKAASFLIFEHARLKAVEPAPDTVPLISCLDPRSTADFASSLLDVWLKEGADSKQRWVLALAGTLGDSRIISLLLPWIPKWCECARHKLAEQAAQAISLLGSNEALMVLDSLANRYRNKFRNVGAAAAKAFQTAADARGIQPDELGDLVVPSFDFDEDGQRRFEWEGGAAVAELTLNLGLEWSNPETEKSLKSLPAAAPAELKAEVKELNKLLREAGKAQTQRLEQALVKQRRWSAPAWQELYEKHPLLRTYATRLVWGVYNGAGRLLRTFRRYPNGLLADAAGSLEELPETGDMIGIVHPLDLDDVALTAWNTHLARFKATPPFPQLDRPVERLDPAHHNRRNLTITGGRSLSYGTFRSRVEKHGWIRGSVVDGGCISDYFKTFPGAGVEVTLPTDGIYIGADPMDRLILGVALFCRAGSIKRGSYTYDDPKPDDPRVLTFGQVPPVVYSETVGDLKAIIAGTSDSESGSDAAF